MNDLVYSPMKSAFRIHCKNQLFSHTRDRYQLRRRIGINDPRMRYQPKPSIWVLNTAVISKGTIRAQIIAIASPVIKTRTSKILTVKQTGRYSNIVSLNRCAGEVHVIEMMHKGVFSFISCTLEGCVHKIDLYSSSDI